MPAFHDPVQGAPRVPVQTGASTSPIDDHARRAFAARLKAQRERRGIGLNTIAANTKISAALLEGLERADLSRWPAGIYRRAFFRDYVTAIGLPVDATTNEFALLFLTEHSEALVPPVDMPREGVDRLRLTLAGPARLFSAMQLRVAVLDAAIVLLSSLLPALVLHVDPWPIIAVVGLLYYSLATTWLGRTPASWWVLRQPGKVLATARTEAAELLLSPDRPAPTSGSHVVH